MIWYNRYILKNMAAHKCNHESDFGEIKTELTDLKKIVKGNGKPGVQETVIRLSEVVENNLVPTIEGLRIAVSGFSKYQSEAEADARAEERAKAEKQVKRNNRHWLIGVIAGLLIVVIEKFL